MLAIIISYFLILPNVYIYCFLSLLWSPSSILERLNYKDSISREADQQDA